MRLRLAIVGIALLLPLILIGFTSPKQPQTAPNPSHSVKAVVHSVPVIATLPPTPTPESTWQDNPQNCNEQTQWIALESPHYCIDIPTASQTPATPTAPTPTAANAYSGSHEDWMRAAGIPEADWKSVDFIISHESGWNPSAVNPTSGACGLGQQLPCGKWAHQWDDPIGALIDANSYAISRYGSWAGAYQFWLDNRYW